MPVAADSCIVMLRRILDIRRQPGASRRLNRPPGPEVPHRLVVVRRDRGCTWRVPAADRSRVARARRWSPRSSTPTMVALAAAFPPGSPQNRSDRGAHRRGAYGCGSGIILLLLNRRLEAWAACLQGNRPRRIVPMQAHSALTLALLLWIGLVLVITSPQALHSGSGGVKLTETFGFGRCKVSAPVELFQHDDHGRLGGGCLETLALSAAAA